MRLVSDIDYDPLCQSKVYIANGQTVPNHESMIYNPCVTPVPVASICDECPQFCFCFHFPGAGCEAITDVTLDSFTVPLTRSGNACKYIGITPPFNFPITYCPPGDCVNVTPSLGTKYLYLSQSGYDPSKDWLTNSVGAATVNFSMQIVWGSTTTCDESTIIFSIRSIVFSYFDSGSVFHQLQGELLDDDDIIVNKITYTGLITDSPCADLDCS